MNKILCLAFLLATARPSHAAFDLGGWKSFRSVLLASAPAGAYARLDLDSMTLGESLPGLGDLRLTAADGTEVPYKIVVARAETRRSNVQVKLLDMAREPERVSFVADFGYGMREHNTICLKTENLNFRRMVELEASENRQAWVKIRDKAVIFDVTAGYKAAHLCVDYPASTRRYLRVSILGRDLPPLQVNGAELSYENSTTVQESTWGVVEGGGRQEGGSSVWDFDVGPGKVPVSRIAFVSDEENFQRPVRAVELDTGPAGEPIRRTLANGTIWRFHLPKIESEELSLRAPEFMAQRFRVELDKGDNAPLRVSRVVVFGPKHSLYFPADRPQPYRLYLGNPRASAPVYDLAAFAGYLDLSRSVGASFLQPGLLNNPAYRPFDPRAWSDRHRAVFLISLVILCIFLFWLIAQKTREILKDGAPPTTGAA